MHNTTAFQENLEQLNPDFKTKKYLLAISGGVDSMVLFHFFQRLNLKFEVSHINYGLRGKDSDADELLVRNICKKNNVPFHFYQVFEKDQKPKNSIQEWARNLRYDFFRKIQEKENIDFIVTAHHLNDDLETFVINLSKASGIKGLSGIPSNENSILRPLLPFTKEEIYVFAKENNIEFREDLSNQKNDYLRNKIRNEITPKLLETNENFLENFGKSLSYLKETRDFVEEKIAELEQKIISEKGNYLELNKKRFLKESDFVHFEILRKFGFTSLEEILKIKNAETGKTFISSEYHLTIDRENLILKKIVNDEEENSAEEIILELYAENEIIFPENIRKEILQMGNLTWKIDAEKVHLPLKLRGRKEGDVFHPIGMIGKKKIAKFFKDEKFPIFAQPKIWLLCDEKNDILGIIPFRQDGRFAATKESREIINVKL